MMKDTNEIGMEDILAPLVGGTLNTDGYLHICKDDVLVVRSPHKLIPSIREEIEKSIADRTGVKVVLLDAEIEVVGVVEA